MIATATESGLKIASVQDLLATLRGNIRTSLLSDFRTTANHLARYLQVPIEQLSIDALVDVTPGFHAYLEQRRYKRNSVRSYCKFAVMLLANAKQLGWTPREPEVPEPWQPILAVVEKAGCKGIVRYAIRQRVAPCNFSDGTLNAWGETMFARGRSYSTVQADKSIFRRVLRDCGFAKKLPRLSQPQNSRQYGIPLSSFPAQLRDQVARLLEWKQAPFALKRPRRCRHRAVTAQMLESAITRLYGFVTKVEPTLSNIGGTRTEQREAINNLVELVTQEGVTSFVQWSINDRKMASSSVTGDLALLYSAVRHYPPLKSQNFSWFSDLLMQIPPHLQSAVDDRKLRKYLPYDVVADIPLKIDDERRNMPEGASRKQALLVRNGLLIRWLTTLPWRQRNIRECKLGVNLVKAEVPQMGGIEIPTWVQARVRTNPNETFWQFHFREEETKNHERVRALLPRQLIPVLEEYLEHYRPLLLNGSDPSTLFLNASGGALDSATLSDLIGEITLRYAHKRVTPHLFRDIFAYKWLRDHPRDYLTLSKLLWHKDLKTTLCCYGSKFDTSHATCQMEEWLDTRAGHVPDLAIMPG
jgi:integrase